MAEGVQIKIATDRAVEAQKKLDAATKDTFVSLEQQNKTIVGLESKLTTFSTSQSKSTPQMILWGKASGETAGKAADAAKAVAQMGASSNATTGFLQKLLAVSGQSGAARGVGLLASGAKALVTSLNPVGLAVGLAAGAIITFASNALAAETPLERLTAAAAKGSAEFSVLGASVSSGGQALLQAASAGKSLSVALFQEFSKEGAKDLFGPILASTKRLEEAIVTVRLESLKSPNGILDTSYAYALAEAIGADEQAFRDLATVMDPEKPKEQAEAFKRLRDAGIQLATSLKRDAFGGVKEAFDVVGINLFGTIDTLQKRLEQQKNVLGGLGAEKARERIAASGNKRFQLGEDIAAKAAAKESERQIGLDLRRSDVLRQLKDDTEILLSVGEDEIRQKRTQAKLNDILAQTETDRDSAAGRSIEAAVIRLEEAEKLNKKLAEVREIGASAGATIGQGLLDAARNGNTLRQALGNVAEGLSQLAAQKFIIDALAKLGAAAFGAFFGSNPGAPGANIGPTMSNGQFVSNTGQARGGFMPSSQGPTGAARGMLLDRFQTFTYNRQRITTNEGGAATPEAIVPLARDEFGRLGVMQAGGGGNITVNVPNARTAADARAIRPTIRQMLGSVERSSARNRGGLRAGR